MPSTEANPAKSRLWLLFRAALSVALLVWLASTVRLGELQQTFTARLGLSMLVAGLLVLASAIPAAERWRIIAQASGVDLNRRDALASSFLSYFALQLAPSTVGADAIRIAALRGKTGRWSSKLASVMIDRAYGVISLVLLSFISLPFLAAVQSDLLMGVAALTLLGFGAIVVAITASFFRAPVRWLRHGSVRATARIVLAFRRACAAPRIFVPALLYSFATHGLCMAAFYLVLWSASDAGAQIASVLGTFAPVGLVSLAPISINGWGVREASMVPLLADFQIEAPAALAGSLAYGLAVTLSGALGLAAWFLIRAARPN